MTMDFYNSRYFSINRRMMTIMGLWPYQDFKTKLFIRTFLAIVLGIALIPQIISIVKYTNEDSDKVIQGIATLLYVTGITLKILTTITSEKKIEIVYRNIVDNWKLLDDENEIRTMTEYSEFGRLLTIGYVAYMFFALGLFVTMPMLPMMIDVISPINGSRPRIFILDGEYIADKNENYGKVYIFESLTCIMSVFVFSTVDSTYAVCVEQCVGLMAVVRLRLKLATAKAARMKYKSDSDEHDIPYQLVSSSAKLHIKAISFARILDSSYSVNFLLSMGSNVMILSVGSVVILINLGRPMEFIRYSMIFIGLMIHMFYLSWPGQKVIDSSQGILYDAYNNEWYECSKKTKTLLKFMMLRCIEPCQLTAGGLYVMNIANFGSLAKTSMSYITVFASFR
ncbi:odorant receptor 142 [Nasonia vitripennis]|uniref:Odorant receptor n=1 Tax=Nasonia vitripennis TaxID=7425 RepID=A0A7M6UGW1_NASVI|nr:odorant receptor 142 [Nasonia vitripennis]